ncbi:hypothetical protein FBY31_3243 [Arthrobacter sp. SLBN-100]|nr:hypothetical protein FBY31_3243 [Arthrobacter sp. SLBN-100]
MVLASPFFAFLAAGAFIGVGCLAPGPEGPACSVAGWTLVFSCCGGGGARALPAG